MIKPIDKITLELTLDELKLIDKYVELNDETQSVFDKIKDAYPKSPVEEAYKDWWGKYPETGTWDIYDEKMWQGFQAGYNAAYEEKVSEWEPTPQTPEQTEQGLKEAFREAVKQGVVSSSTKQKTLSDVIAQWSFDVVTDSIDVPTCVEDLVCRIEEWLPKEHDTNDYKWNQCIRTIKEKLR